MRGNGLEERDSEMDEKTSQESGYSERYDIRIIKLTRNTYKTAIDDSEFTIGKLFDIQEGGELYRGMHLIPYMGFDYHDMMFVLDEKHDKDSSHLFMYKDINNIGRIREIGSAVVAAQAIALFKKNKTTSYGDTVQETALCGRWMIVLKRSGHLCGAILIWMVIVTKKACQVC